MGKETFSVRIDQLQPTQTHLSQARIESISRHVGFLAKPLAVKLIEGRLCVVDGHERLFALSSVGQENVEVYMDDNSGLTDEAFMALVKYCCDKGITSIHDLENRVVSPRNFKMLWLDEKRKILEPFHIKTEL